MIARDDLEGLAALLEPVERGERIRPAAVEQAPDQFARGTAGETEAGLARGRAACGPEEPCRLVAGIDHSAVLDEEDGPLAEGRSALGPLPLAPEPDEKDAERGGDDDPGQQQARSEFRSAEFGYAQSHIAIRTEAGKFAGFL